MIIPFVLLSLLSADRIAAQLLVPQSPAVNWTCDTTGLRTLSGAGLDSASMTNAQCVQYCTNNGFFFAGTEYAGECYCGNNLNNGASIQDPAGCNMGCKGNTAEACGGPNRLTLFNSTVRPLGPFVNPGVKGFLSLGCYSDETNARALSVGVGVPGGAPNMTVDNCITTCASLGGYTYAGVEYAGECYCGTEILNGASPATSGCNMPCHGNATEYCGGSYRLNLYTNKTAPDGWALLGCYTDSQAKRTLPFGQATAGALTTENCIAACSGAGYVYAGTEYGGECYCGNTIMNGGGPAPDGNAGCNMPCKGNALQTCGGPNRLNLYIDTDVMDQPSSTLSMPTPKVSTATPPVAQSSTVEDSNVNTPLPVSSSAVSSSPAASSTSAPNPQWVYQGCWTDNAYGRIFNYQVTDNPELTIETCISNCTSLGYSVAGMEYSYQCFCGNYLQNGAVPAPEADCNAACSGNANQKCGAGNRLSVYSNSSNALTVYPVPAPQRGNLTGKWQYSGCIRDDGPQKLLPYQIILSNNNTANNCISQCSTFGYSAGGLEYGDECYCGDITAVTPAPESDCSFTCSGNVTGICGGPARLSYYTWSDGPLQVWDYPTGDAAGHYQFLIGGVVVPLITQAAKNGKVTFLEKSGTGVPNATGAYELDLAQLNNFTGAWRTMHVKTDVFCSGSITLPDTAARQLNVGGWSLESTFGVRLYWPDGSPGVDGTNDWQENVDVLALQNGRWYPTSMIMANGSILVVGGEGGSNGVPVPTLEILPTVGPTVYCPWLFRTDPNNLYPYLAVLPTGGIFVQYYNEAIVLDEVTFAIKKKLPNTPGAVNNFLAGRTYPMEGTAVLLPQYPPYTDPLKIMICGGSTPAQGFALDNCITIAPEEPNPNWVIERMPSRRVLTCIAALPDGTYLILNGAHQGFGGFGLATDPNTNAVLYNPRKPEGRRFSVMADTTIARLYHSEAIVLDDGRVLVSGSDPEDDRFPQEYRVEVFIPPYLMGNPTQPVVSMAESQKDWNYMRPYTFTSTQPIANVSLLAAGSSTHGNSMGQRTLFVSVSLFSKNADGSYTYTVTAPPNAHVCPPGWFQMFALNFGGVPSVANWVRVGGDPANLGAWPDAPEDFDVPNPKSGPGQH